MKLLQLLLQLHRGGGEKGPVGEGQGF
jgi:hypothetical protein